jgi:hypothetical protein
VARTPQLQTLPADQVEAGQVVALMAAQEVLEILEI